MYYSPPDHDHIIFSLRSILTQIGVPQRRILFHPHIEISTSERFDADMVVVAEDFKTPLFQFELKLANGKPDLAFEKAKTGLRGLWRHHRCFVVTAEYETIRLSEIDESGTPNWIPLNDAGRVAEMLGDVKQEASRQVAKDEEKRREIVAKDCKSLLSWVGVVGGVALVSAIVGEFFGKELSWKIYYLMTLVLGVIAAAHGLVFYVKVGENEVRIVDRGRSVDDVELRENENPSEDGEGGVKA